MKRKLTVTLMCGLPRSGKSTWIEKNKDNNIVVCPDKVRKEIFGHQFHQNAEDFVWAFSMAMVKLLLEQNKNVIIDATNLTEWSREKWIKIANAYGAEIKIIWIKTPLHVCKNRNKTCPKKERISLKIFDRMNLIFEEPNFYKKNISVKHIKI